MEIAVRMWSDLSGEERQRILARSESNIDALVRDAAEIVNDVRERGDVAVREHSARLDGVPVELPLAVTARETESAIESLEPAVRSALDYAIENVRRVHRRQAPHDLTLTEVRPGILAGERVTPIESVGLYVPRGRGSFPSMLYMLAVPAAIAGVPSVTVTTPPDAQGRVDPACLYAAWECGVHRVIRAGGIQAIAALAYGTDEIPAVRKIVGPGSAYVAAAKRIVRDQVDVGLPAGPSESMILADASADAERVAMDLLIEAEHGADSQALLVTDCRALADQVASRLPSLVATTPEPRRGYLEKVFSSYGAVIVTSSLEQSVEVVNQFAPEHLQIRTAEPFATMQAVRNAGEILLGEHSAFSLANYATGANAVLPTGGHAVTWSGVSVHDFEKRTSVVKVDSESMGELGAHVATLADYEGFHWHARAVRERS